jgi:hypothetical protein
MQASTHSIVLSDGECSEILLRMSALSVESPQTRMPLG